MAKKSSDDMDFWEHLEDLRWHIIRAIVAVMGASVVAFIAKDFIFDIILLAPREPEFFTNKWLSDLSVSLDMPALQINKTALDLQSIQLSGQLGVHITVSLVAGIIFSFPYVFYQLWSFVSPALHKKEKRSARIAVATVSLLFFIGVLFGYFIIAPLAVDFLGTYRVSSAVENTINIKSYVGSMTSILLSSGIVFELPVLIYFLVKVGIVNARFLRKYRKHAVVLIMALSAILTPPDPFSLVLVCLPLLLLYELSIYIAVYVEKRRTKALVKK
ncbi:Sec-independent protein translocase TatC [Balneicella halophila]|uniref:Sec-independent protein translocase protein TatC n=1 Tax=Balneicella halophila TaxID=1537566 RepID=A0A7L4UPA6_BALHA|nr:twin-arginine translocase subunit TatC [Balneicella halophila]PVX50973.1 Sec-independent protein translocase TatC [Balneicella halophila]